MEEGGDYSWGRVSVLPYVQSVCGRHKDIRCRARRARLGAKDEDKTYPDSFACQSDAIKASKSVTPTSSPCCDSKVVAWPR